MGPHFCSVFSTICGTVVQQQKKNIEVDIRFLRPPGPFLGSGVVEILCAACVTKQQVFRTMHDLLVAEASRRHALQGEALLCGSHHVVRMPENT